MGNYDTLHLYALDHLSCSAMATQCERVFSAARRTLTPERNALGLKVLEACECLRWWWKNGVMSGIPTVCPMTPRAVVEAQFVTALVGDSTSSDASEGGIDWSHILLRGGTFPIRAIPLPIIRCY